MTDNKNKRIITTMSIKPATLNRLADICHKKESYDEVINKLIDHYHNFTIKGGAKKK